jgi:hypothetical protein
MDFHIADDSWWLFDDAGDVWPDWHLDRDEF